MRTIETISPTALKIWETDRELFYQRYLSDKRPPREPQTEAMAVGSAFDAFVKSALHSTFCDPDPAFELNTLLHHQVDDPFMCERARKAGRYLMNCYVECGAYDDLCGMISAAEQPPRFEFKVTRKVSGVPLLGKPDCWFNLGGTDVILDWKVNGYMSKSATSPRPLYKCCMDTWDIEKYKPTRGGSHKPHKNYDPMFFGGMEIGRHWLEDVDRSWADQVAIYGWMMGMEPGSEDFITCIDQFACKPCEDEYPLIRVAQHRCRISAFWQFNLITRLQSCWESIQENHIFTDMSKEESIARCELLDEIEFDDDEFWALCRQKGFMG